MDRMDRSRAAGMLVNGAPWLDLELTPFSPSHRLMCPCARSSADASSDRLRANARCVKCRTRGADLKHPSARDSDISLVPPPGQELCRHLQTTFLKQIETFPDGEVLFDHCNKFGFEGVVSKRRASGYSSSPSRHWIKVNCPDWKRDNAERWRIFKQPEQTERQRALVNKLACILEQLRTPGLRQGIARELRNHVAFLRVKSLNWSRPDAAHALVKWGKRG
jgi:hypothetical protein